MPFASAPSAAAAPSVHVPREEVVSLNSPEPDEPGAEHRAGARQIWPDASADTPPDPFPDPGYFDLRVD